MYTVNGDESHEGKAERVFAVAGCLEARMTGIPLKLLG
jgi:hypothetical protein